MGSISFSASLQKRGPAAAVVLSDEQVAAVGEGAKRFPVKATVAGYTWRGSVARMRGEFLLGLNREDLRRPRLHPPQGVRALDRRGEERGDA